VIRNDFVGIKDFGMTLVRIPLRRTREKSSYGLNPTFGESAVLVNIEHFPPSVKPFVTLQFQETVHHLYIPFLGVKVLIPWFGTLFPVLMEIQVTSVVKKTNPKKLFKSFFYDISRRFTSRCQQICNITAGSVQDEVTAKIEVVFVSVGRLLGPRDAVGLLHIAGFKELLANQSDSTKNIAPLVFREGTNFSQVGVNRHGVLLEGGTKQT